jgi:hypothetical protein
LLDIYPYFHKTHSISTAQNVQEPLVFAEIGSMLQINGREIFQKERVDRKLSGGPETVLARYSGNRVLADRFRKALTAECNNGKAREARVQARRSRVDLKQQSAVIWNPNQVFKKSERRGEIPKGKSPLRFVRSTRFIYLSLFRGS